MSELNQAGELICEKIRLLNDKSVTKNRTFTLKKLSRITHIDYDYLRKTLHSGTGKVLGVKNMVKIAIELRLSYEEALELINRFGSDIRYDWQSENEVYRRAIRTAQKGNIAEVQEILDELLPCSNNGTTPESEMDGLAMDGFIDWSVEDLL